MSILFEALSSKSLQKLFGPLAKSTRQSQKQSQIERQRQSQRLIQKQSQRLSQKQSQIQSQKQRQSQRQNQRQRQSKTKNKSHSPTKSETVSNAHLKHVFRTRKPVKFVFSEAYFDINKYPQSGSSP